MTATPEQLKAFWDRVRERERTLTEDERLDYIAQCPWLPPSAPASFVAWAMEYDVHIAEVDAPAIQNMKAAHGVE